MVIYNSGLGGYVGGLGGRTEELSVYGGVPDQFVILRQDGVLRTELSETSPAL